MSIWQRIGKNFRRFHTIFQVTVFALGASLLSLLLYWIAPTPLEQLDQRSQDFAFRLRSAPPPPPQIAVVTVDERSIKRYGRWPWSRRLQAQLIAQLKTLGASVLALDIVYTQPESPEADQALMDALDMPGAAVVGGYFFRSERTLGGDEAARELLRRERIKLILRAPGSHLDTIASFPFVETNQDEIAEHFSGQGFFNAIFDIDGLIRSVPTIMKFEDDYYPSLMLEALSVYAGAAIGLQASPEGLGAVRIGSLNIPVDVSGRLALNFYNGEETIPLLSASHILDGTIGAEQIQDRLIFIGVTEYGIADLRPTPIDISFPGVMLHATAAGNIMQGFYLVRDNRILLLNVGLMALVPLFLVLILTQIRRPFIMALVFAGIISGGSLIFYVLVTKYGFMVSFVYPTLAVGLGFSAFVSYYIVTSQRKNRFLTQAFSSYVSPKLVDQLLKDPDRLKLAGEKREITVLFSDLRGFTTISESMPPEQLATMLSIYLDAMCEIVMDQRGTLDKYIGDAIMAIFNAPLDIENHPLYAATTALLMQRQLASMNDRFADEFGIRLQMGIGLHTGLAIVGNLGGAHRFDYTAVGDTINLGARLESATKQYQVDILISQTTREHLDDKFLCRKIDRIQVKGKKQAVEIHQLMGFAENIDLLALIERFEAALTAYFRRDFEQALQICRSLQQEYPDDGPTHLLTQRCNTFIASPPPPDWDGVFVATQK